MHPAAELAPRPAHVLPDLPTRIKRCARDAGFDLCGIAPVRDFAELQVFPPWIADGKHGEMKYMEARDEAGELKRASLARVAPWARSVIVCAINYNTAHPYSTQARKADASRGWISRYAWSREDYHDAVMRRLKQVEEGLRGLLDSTGHWPLATGHCLVDTGPLIERVFAKYAGMGWIGKNTCVINQQLGSWLFLGVILTSLEFADDDLTAGLPAPDRCGTCTRCIAACPTQAIVAPGELDARLCISYLTIEKRGEIPAELRSGMGRHVFGCDICQDVCPWNRKAPEDFRRGVRAAGRAGQSRARLAGRNAAGRIPGGVPRISRPAREAFRSAAECGDCDGKQRRQKICAAAKETLRRFRPDSRGARALGAGETRSRILSKCPAASTRYPVRAS